MSSKIHKDTFIEKELAYIKRLWEENLPHECEHIEMVQEAYNVTCLHLDHIMSRAKGLPIKEVKIWK